MKVFFAIAVVAIAAIAAYFLFFDKKKDTQEYYTDANGQQIPVTCYAAGSGSGTAQQTSCNVNINGTPMPKQP